MSKKEKLIERLKSNPNDFTYVEMVTLLKLLGYKQDNLGKTSGSRVKFCKSQDSIVFHKPHPQNEIKPYLVKQILNMLIGKGDIK